MHFKASVALLSRYTLQNCLEADASRAVRDELRRVGASVRLVRKWVQSSARGGAVCLKRNPTNLLLFECDAH